MKNPLILGFLSRPEWNAFYRHVQSQDVLLAAPETILLRGQGRSIDIFWTHETLGEEMIGMLYIEQHLDKFPKYLKRALVTDSFTFGGERGQGLEEEIDRIVVYYEWFEDVNHLFKEEWAQILQSLSSLLFRLSGVCLANSSFTLSEDH